MKSYRFYKEGDNWFIDLPEWGGDKWDLQMVSGADVFLDILSQGEPETWVCLSETPFDGCEILEYQHDGFEEGSGAWYMLKHNMTLPYDLKMWLCDVTLFLFNKFPHIIYFK